MWREVVEVYAAFTVRGNVFITRWKIGTTATNLSRNQGISVLLKDRRKDKGKHQSEWCAFGNNQKCMRCVKKKNLENETYSFLPSPDVDGHGVNQEPPEVVKGKHGSTRPCEGCGRKWSNVDIVSQMLWVFAVLFGPKVVQKKCKPEPRNCEEHGR